MRSLLMAVLAALIATSAFADQVPGPPASGGAEVDPVYSASAFNGKTLSGNGTVIATVSGALISGNCLEPDGNGNLIDSGRRCLPVILGGDPVDGVTSCLAQGELAINNTSGDLFWCANAGTDDWEPITATAGMADPGSNGIVARTALNTTVARTITGDSEITVANGDGVSGNPTLAIAASITRDSELATHEGNANIHHTPPTASTLSGTDAGTDLTGDLEEETHAAEHAENAADELLVESLGTGCADGLIPKANATGGLDCATDNSGGGGTPNVLDLADDAANESADLVEIATVNDPDSVFTEPSPDKLLIDLAPVRLESEEHAGTDPTADLEEEAHASEHQHGGADEIATATPGANAVPKADALGDLADGWIPDAIARDSEIPTELPPTDGSVTAAKMANSAVDYENLLNGDAAADGNCVKIANEITGQFLNEACVTAATQVPTTPAGGLSSTNAQAALNELDTEKLGPVDTLGSVSTQESGFDHTHRLEVEIDQTDATNPPPDHLGVLVVEGRVDQGTQSAAGSKSALSWVEYRLTNLDEAQAIGLNMELICSGQGDCIGISSNVYNTGGVRSSGDEGTGGFRAETHDTRFTAVGTISEGITAGGTAAFGYASLSTDEERELGTGKPLVWTDGAATATRNITANASGILTTDGADFPDVFPGYCAIFDAVSYVDDSALTQNLTLPIVGDVDEGNCPSCTAKQISFAFPTSTQASNAPSSFPLGVADTISSNVEVRPCEMLTDETDPDTDQIEVDGTEFWGVAGIQHTQSNGAAFRIVAMPTGNANAFRMILRNTLGHAGNSDGVTLLRGAGSAEATVGFRAEPENTSQQGFNVAFRGYNAKTAYLLARELRASADDTTKGSVIRVNMPTGDWASANPHAWRMIEVVQDSDMYVWLEGPDSDETGETEGKYLFGNNPVNAFTRIDGQGRVATRQLCVVGAAVTVQDPDNFTSWCFKNDGTRIYADLNNNDTFDAGTEDLFGSGSLTLDDLTDVIGTPVSDSQVLTHVSGFWGAGYPEDFRAVVKGSAGTINKGQPVYVTGYSVGDSAPTVELCDADTPATMPCIGLADESVTNAALARVMVSGTMESVDTSAWASGAELYVATTAGTLTDSPTASALDTIQHIATVGRSDVSVGTLIVHANPGAAIGPDQLSRHQMLEENWGDFTNSASVFTINNSAIGTAKITNDAVTPDKLADGSDTPVADECVKFDTGFNLKYENCWDIDGDGFPEIVKVGSVLNFDTDGDGDFEFALNGNTIQAPDDNILTVISNIQFDDGTGSAPAYQSINAANYIWNLLTEADNHFRIGANSATSAEVQIFNQDATGVASLEVEDSIRSGVPSANDGQIRISSAASATDACLVNPGGAQLGIDFNCDDVVDFTFDATGLSGSDLGSTGSNLISIFDHDTDVSPDPTCANKGVDGKLTLLDVDESADDHWVVCVGTSEQVSFGEERFVFYVDGMDPAVDLGRCFPANWATTGDLDCNSNHRTSKAYHRPLVFEKALVACPVAAAQDTDIATFALFFENYDRTGDVESTFQHTFATADDQATVEINLGGIETPDALGSTGTVKLQLDAYTDNATANTDLNCQVELIARQKG